MVYTTNRVDFAMPCIAADCSRLELYLRSRRALCEVPGTLFIFAREHELDCFKTLRDEYKFELCTQQEVLGPAAFAPGGIPGWWQQQFVKLGAYRFVDTPFYVAVDADMFHARKVARVCDLLINDKLPWLRKSLSDSNHSERRQGMERLKTLFGFPPSMELSGVPMWRPPFYFDTQIVRMILARLGLWVSTLAQHRIEGGIPGEAYVYATGAQCLQLWDAYHAWTDEGVTHEFIRYPYVDVAADFACWNPLDTFSGKWLFGVVHSKTRIPATATIARLQAVGINFPASTGSVAKNY